MDAVRGFVFLRIIKIALIPLLVSIAVSVIVYFSVSRHMMHEAEKHIQNILLSHRGVHHYIQRVMHPEFYTAREKKLISPEYYSPELLSSSFMVRVLHLFYNEERTKAGLPEIYYKLASENPRNPVNKADELEIRLIRMFNENRNVKQYREIITINGKKYLYYAMPFLETTTACLRCHGLRSDAPSGLQKKYPGSGGFNEKAERVRAIESIRAPIGQEISTSAILTASITSGIFAMVLLSMFNLRLRRTVKAKTRSLEEENAVRKKAEADLTLFRDLIDRFDDAILIIQPETGRFLRMNEKACANLGYTQEELTAMNVADIDHEISSGRKWTEFVKKVKAEGGGIITSAFVRKDGTSFPVEANVKYISVSGGDYLVAVARDITERKKLEAQVRQWQKMEAIGRLAGGVAHDFNNILTAIIGHASLIKMKMQANDPRLDDIYEILSSSERATQLTKSLLAFSRKQVLDVKRIDLNQVVGNFKKFIQRLIGEDIQLSILLYNTPLEVIADGNQIEQILMNLVANARDAMPNGGSLKIRTEIAELDEAFLRPYGYGTPGGYAQISVADTGCGIEENIRSKIFEPFFTTKELGRGTGLGLSIVYGIIRQHEGIITVESETGKGTVFKIYLPLAIEKDAETGEKTDDPSPPARGSETILLAEDEPDVRDLTRHLLEIFGYTVITAEDGVDAIQKFVKDKHKISLAILDMIMPRKNAKEVFDEIKQAKPGIKGLFISGYTADIIRERGLLHDNMELMYKPVLPKDLLAKVREILDRQ